MPAVLKLVTMTGPDRLASATSAAKKEMRDREMKEMNYIKGVFLVSAKNAFVPVKRDNSMNTYSRISTLPRGSERSE